MSDKTRAPKKVTIDYKNGKIYKLVNDVNDMIYIGSTTTTLSRRFSGHKAHAKAASSNIYTAMRELGCDHFKIVLIELFPCTCKAELEAREYAVINGLDRETVYNSLFDGKPDAVTKQKLSECGSGKGKFGPDSHVFKRGCVSEYQDRNRVGFRFSWYENGKQRCKSFAFGTKRTREMAYMLCVEYRNQIFPLTDEDQPQELPVAE